jgi:hypothetical protein
VCSSLPLAAQAFPGRASVPSATPAATILFRNGLNAKQVQLWLGHHSPAFTLAVCVHLSADDLPDPGFLDALCDPTTSRAKHTRTDDRQAS